MSDWIKVCDVQDLVSNSGVCALVRGKQIALFSVQQAANQQVYAISNWDPIGKANVLSRGVLGSIGENTVVASPLYKQHFCLRTGLCLEDADQQVQVYRARIENNHVQLQWVD
ncbi:nitrite reductase small subunit NirD [Neptunicella sp. SCSIO 80796]|uniref:nitrite reductase small subunit NirD n=1 Tax=Neptunicella plasticusilytica TaxID=3117012 RepID=UPI003A4DC1B7